MLMTSCGEDNDPLVPEMEVPITGYLCTTGIGDFSKKDTLAYNAHGGTKDLVSFPGYNQANERVTLTPRGDGIWSLERVNVYSPPAGGEYFYFGCYAIGTTAGYPAGYSDFLDRFGYKYTLRTTFTPDCEFVLTRVDDDPDQFYLESKLYPGYYLSPATYIKGNSPKETWLAYGPDRRAFFMIK